MAIDGKQLDDSKDKLSRAQVIIKKIEVCKDVGVVDIDGNDDLAIPLKGDTDVISLWEDRAQQLIDDAKISVPIIGDVKGVKVGVDPVMDVGP